MKASLSIIAAIAFLSSQAFSSTVALPRNLLTNPGFETGDLSGWIVGGKHGGTGVLADGIQQPVTSALPGSPSLFFQSWQNVHEGLFAGYAITAGNDQDIFSEFASFSQNIFSVPLGTYRLGFFMGTDNEVGGFGISSPLDDLRLAIFVDGLHARFIEPEFSSPFSTNFRGGSAPEDFVEFYTELELSGDHTVEFRISGSGTYRAGISVDDFYVTAIPEPNSAILFTLTTAILTVRRRIH